MDVNNSDVAHSHAIFLRDLDGYSTSSILEDADFPPNDTSDYGQQYSNDIYNIGSQDLKPTRPYRI